MINLAHARLRSNPRFKLVPFDQLGISERRTFQSLSEEPDFYGLLVPPSDSSAPLKSISREAALLFMTLREPACIPHLLASLFSSNAEERIRELILDGIIEVEHSGRFVAGPTAIPLICGRSVDSSVSRVAMLSFEAIAYASALEGLPTNDIATRLYMFNRCPSSSYLQKQFADDNRLVAHLTAGTDVIKRLGRGWKCEIGQSSWLVWHRPTTEAHHGFKLYISPTLNCLPEAFRIAVDTFVQVGCSQFKVGRTAFGLLRPDKLVAYFHCLEQLQEASELIRASAVGISAQGVPFSAAIDADGLVSWGMDPPRFEQVLAWQKYQSWRQWVAARIAVYIVAAKEDGTGSIPDFVRHRVALDGIDPSTWTPNLAIWRERAGSTEEVA